MIFLYSYNVSPYAAKVRAILKFKSLEFQERVVHPLRRGDLRRLSGQEAVPVLVDGADVVADSTRIAQFLDEKYPEKPILPRDAGLRARALLAEDWADEALPAAIQPVRWVLPVNAERTAAKFRSAYPPGRADDVAFAVVRRVLQFDERRKFGTRGGRLPASVIQVRLAQAMDLLDAALVETGWLAGPDPTVADFAAWGFVSQLDGLDGWESVRARPHVAKWLDAMKAPRSTQRRLNVRG
jgi:glutathione S-transferase